MKQTRRQFVRTLFVASQGVVASPLLPTSILAGEPPQSDGLNFLVFGDWGRRGEQDQVEVAEQMAKAAAALNPRFIVSVGDNFYENGVSSVDDPHWQKSFEQVYRNPALQVPWYCILGNHDYHLGGNCDAQISYHRINPRWNMPARYYQKTHAVDDRTKADIFYLDTTPMIGSYYSMISGFQTRKNVMTQDVPKQLAWFKTALAASSAPWKIVIAHHPIYSGGGHGNSEELIENILPLLHEHKVQAYFNGHDHDLQHLVAGQVNLFDSGAGSQHTPTRYTRRSKFAKSCSGFTAVSLQADKMDVRMIDNHGRQVYATTVARG